MDVSFKTHGSSHFDRATTTSHASARPFTASTQHSRNGEIEASPSKTKARSRRKTAQAEDEDSSKRRCVSTACIACRKRKSKCDGNTPACAACSQVYGTDCIYDPNSDHRRKGVYKNDAENLKTRDSTLHTLIQAILNYSEEEVPALVQQIRTCESLDDVAEKIVAKENGLDLDDEDEDAGVLGSALSSPATFESNLYGKMGDLRLDEGAVRYIGGTSNLIHVGEEDDESMTGDEYPQQENAILSWTMVTDDSELVMHLLNMYFTWHYTYFTTLSKTLFYRDFKLGRPPLDTKRTRYCSPLLVNAMLALGCHFTGHAGARELPDDSATAGDHFFREAKRLLMEDDVLERPRLTTVQALALMSVREAGCGREAKGWVYSGMSFRMSQDMGLHLDSGQLANSTQVSGDEADDDARKITFWGCFLFDKCWSNYLGRMPQLPRSLVTTPKFEVFPDEDAADWIPYTDSGFTVAHSQPARTRAVALEIAKLCEISNDVLQNFYNPTNMDKIKGKQAELKKLSDIHTRLESWRRELPKEFEPREGGLSSVLVMHMFFQLLYIHLFRPFLKYTQATSPLPSNVSPRKLCTQAAATISKLLRLYKRSHGLRQICNIAVYIAHSACTIHLLNLPDKNARRDIIHGVKHLEEIAEGWLCARRSLGILSLLATRWNVELPYEAATVLTRTDARYGAYKRDGQSPNGGDYKAGSRPATAATTAAAPAYVHITPLGSMAQQAPGSSFAAGLQYEEDSRQNADYAIVTSPTRQHYTSESTSPLNISGAALPAVQHAYQMQQQQQRQQAVSRANAQVKFNNGQDILMTPRSDASPSAMFGGIEQLLRDSQDWALRDQAQLGTGFGNWVGVDDESVAAWPTTAATTRQATNNAVVHDRRIGQSVTASDHQAMRQQTPGTSLATFATTSSASIPAALSNSHVNRSDYAISDWTSSNDGSNTAAMNVYNSSMMHYDENEWYE